MFYGYPWTEARNWVHQSLVEVLTTVHAAVAVDRPVPPWPDTIPAAHRVRLRRRTGLRDRIDRYATALAVLTVDEQDQVRRALTEQNCVAELVSGVGECQCVNELPEAMRQPIAELFRFAFELLTDLGVRDEQYGELYRSATGKVCPFCGCEYFDAPGAPREHLDHYLAFSLYPFAGANLRNLVPMGARCNAAYKLAQDVLRRPDGTRRVSPDPYAAAPVTVSLEQSEPFAGEDAVHPRWEIALEPDCDAIGTWDEVFHIRERFARDVLDPSFMSWLKDFRSWVRSARAGIGEDLLTALDSYTDYHAAMGFRDRAFLRVAVFRMLKSHCESGNQRLIELLHDLTGLRPVANGAAA